MQYVDKTEDEEFVYFSLQGILFLSLVHELFFEMLIQQEFIWVLKKILKKFIHKQMGIVSIAIQILCRYSQNDMDCIKALDNCNQQRLFDNKENIDPLELLAQLLSDHCLLQRQR